MIEKKIKRLYIMPEVWVTVTQSQVFNWIKLINEEGIKTDCISITPNKHDKKGVEEIEKAISGRFIEVTDFRRLLVNDVYFTYIFLKYYFKNVFTYDRIIFQTRLSSLGLTFAALKWLPKTKFIFESRGAGTAERTHMYSQSKRTLKTIIKDFFSNTSEKLMLTKSHKVICVSEALKEYYSQRFNLKTDKFIVFPGAADDHLFFLDNDVRKKFRKRMNLRDQDILIAYSGRLEMKWEIPNKIVEFFKDLHLKNSNFKLLLLTPDINIANELIEESDIKDVSYALSVDLDEVNSYLNASDLGLLLREDVPMNNVASPTKFAEYLMAGLPIIISYGIYDFANVINKTGYGVVVSRLETIYLEEYEKLKESLNIDKTEIAQYGLKNLSKKTYINKYIELLKTV